MGKIIGKRVAVALAALTACWVCSVGTVQGQDTGVLYGVRAVRGQLIMRSLDLGSSQGTRERGQLARAADERLAGVFQSNDRGIGVVSASSKGGAQRRALVRMVGIPEHLIDVSSGDIAGLSSAYAITSVQVPPSGPPLALVARYTDTPPFWLANVDLKSGQVKILDVPLNPKTHYSHLARCPDGSVYSVSMDPEWKIQLVRLDVDQHAVTPIGQLQLNGQSLRVGLSALACAPSGQLYALADPSHAGMNSLFRVEIATGTLTWVQKFDVDRMVFVR